MKDVVLINWRIGLLNVHLVFFGSYETDQQVWQRNLQPSAFWPPSAVLHPASYYHSVPRGGARKWKRCSERNEMHLVLIAS